MNFVVDLIKKNIKFLVIMLFVILIGIFGITYAIRIGNAALIGLNIGTANVNVNITYANSSDENIVRAGKLMPIEDSSVTYNSTDERILKSKFYVTGVSGNPSNTIYDIALHNVEMDCVLRSSDVKWKLFKNGTLLTSGNFSPTFDAMNDQRLVLTSTQEDLTTTRVEYVFVMWISESCTGDIKTCTKSQDQSKYLNSFFSSEIKVELSTKTKKPLVRSTGSELSCSYQNISVPTCNTLTYNGSEQSLVSVGSNYVVENGTGKDAGNYSVSVSPRNGYKWTDNSTDSKILNCSINKKDASIMATDQIVSKSISYTNNVSKVTTSGLISGHTLSSIFINSNSASNEAGTLTPSAPVILDSSNNDVTNNYNIKMISGNARRKASPEIQVVEFPENIVYQNTSLTYSYTSLASSLTGTCTTSNPSIATCQINNSAKTFTLTLLDEGKVDIILNFNETSTYDAFNMVLPLTIGCETVSEPSTNELIYNGEVQIGVYGPEGLNYNGSISATNAGSYIGTATPKKGYCWEDGSKVTKSYDWEIKRSPTAVEPSVSQINYDIGSSITGVSGGSNIILSGDTSARYVGIYTAYATPKANYTWSDGTENRKAFTWSITQDDRGKAFSGTSNYLNVGYSNYQFDKNITLAARFKRNVSNTAEEIIICDYESAGFGLTTSNNKMYFTVYNSSTSSYTGAISTTSITPNTWYTVVGTYDGRYLKIYVNGVLEDTVAFSQTLKVTAAPMFIGANPTASGVAEGGYLNGSISDLMLMHTALDQNTIARNFTNGFNSDELSNTSADHVSGKYFNGTAAACTNMGHENYNFGKNFTIGARFKPTSVGAYTNVVANSQGGGFELAVSDANKIRGYVYSTASSGYIYIDSSTTVQANQWYNAVFTYDGSNLKLYVNGVLEASRAFTESLKVSTAPIMAGGNPNASGVAEGQYFTGTISDILIAKKALDATTISNNYGTNFNYNKSVSTLTYLNSALVSRSTGFYYDFKFDSNQTYNITYNANGGSGAPSSELKMADENLALSTVVPTRTGYTFLGWATSSTATSAEYQSGATYTQNNSLNLYAVWKVNQVHIQYNTAGGSIATTSNSSGTWSKDSSNNVLLNNSIYEHIVDYGSSTDPCNYNNSGFINISKSGYVGTAGAQWISSSGTKYNQDTSYDSSKYCDASNGDCTVVLSVNWVAASYTISYNANGGSGAPASQTKTYGTTLTLSSAIPTKSGNIFAGWATSSSGSVAYAAGASYTANASATLYAKWTSHSSHSWNARGNTKHSVSSWSCGCGSTHSSTYSTYCSVCGMSARYYSSHYSYVSQYVCINYPYGSSDGWTIFNDSSMDITAVGNYGGLMNGQKLLSRA